MKIIAAIIEFLYRLLQFLKSQQGLTFLTILAVGAVSWALTSCHAEMLGQVAAGAILVGGAAGGTHVADGPVTTTLAREASPSLLRSEIDSRIVRLRPMSTPVDQISRYAGSRKSGSMTVEYYSVDTKPSGAMLKAAVAGNDAPEADYEEVTITTDNDRVFDATETILVPSVMGADGKSPLMLYVKERTDAGLKVIAVNGPKVDGFVGQVPAISAGVALIRMGRAAGELDVQTAQFEALPRKSFNFCQIFKAQIEASTMLKAANKEVGWTFSDQEEVAVYDMRLGLEKSFLFGARGRIVNPDSQSEVFFTGGIWSQAGQEASYDKATLNSKKWVEIMRTVFTRNSGSKRKILIGGSGLIEAINKMDAPARVMMPGDTVTKWGLDFHEIHSKFGSLYVIHSEVFDLCGHEDDGLVIDPDFLSKYSHIPFSSERLDLRSSGQRNTEAVVITEASCLVLRQPMAHTRIVAEQ